MKSARTIENRTLYIQGDPPNKLDKQYLDYFHYLRRLQNLYHKTADVNKKADIYIEYCEIEYLYLESIYARKKELSKEFDRLFARASKGEDVKDQEDLLYSEDVFILKQLEKHNIAPPRPDLSKVDNLEDCAKRLGCAIIQQAFEENSQESRKYILEGVDLTIRDYDLDLNSEVLKDKIR